MTSADDIIYGPIEPQYVIRNGMVCCDCIGNIQWSIDSLLEHAKRKTHIGCPERPDDCPILVFYRKLLRDLYG